MVRPLQNIFGNVVAAQIVEYLKQENVISEEGVVDTKKLDSALTDLFGQASLPIMHKLLVVQKKSFSSELR